MYEWQCILHNNLKHQERDKRHTKIKYWMTVQKKKIKLQRKSTAFPIHNEFELRTLSLQISYKHCTVLPNKTTLALVDFIAVSAFLSSLLLGWDSMEFSFILRQENIGLTSDKMNYDISKPCRKNQLQKNTNNKLLTLQRKKIKWLHSNCLHFFNHVRE